MSKSVRWDKRSFPNLFQALMDINTGIIESGNPADMLQSLLDAAVKLFQVKGCSLGLRDRAGTGLAFTVYRSDTGLKQFFVPEGQGFAGWTVKTGRGVLSNKPQEDPRFFVMIDEQTGHKTRNLMCAPLDDHGKITGVIQVLNTQKRGGFSASDLALLTSFGKMAAAAIRGHHSVQAADMIGSLHREEEDHRYPLVWGNSDAMARTVSMARKVAKTNATVLLMSESGTGKEVLAHRIHRWSAREDEPFVAVNCVALTPELLGSELFGHEKGAFTGASQRKIGKFELADGGTIFLDEIGELDLELQAKLLRVLQEREFQRIGGNEDIRTNVRILAATNRDLRKAVEEGIFREDLYYRLCVVTMELPPLRERREDIPKLVDHFLQTCANEMGRPPVQITQPALQALQHYEWPGNIRQLRNTIERAVVLTTGSLITPGSLPVEVRRHSEGRNGGSSQSSGGTSRSSITNAVQSNTASGGTSTTAKRRATDTLRGLSLADALEQFKRIHIERVLEANNWHQTKAAEELGLQPSNFSRMLKKLDIKQP